MCFNNPNLEWIKKNKKIVITENKYKVFGYIEWYKNNGYGI